LQIQTVLQQTQDRFQTMSQTVMARIDTMSERINDIERKLDELIAEVRACARAFLRKRFQTGTDLDNDTTKGSQQQTAN